VLFGTGFATSGFSFDPNLSPHNQAFVAAVLAVLARGLVTVGSTGTATATLANTKPGSTNGAPFAWVPETVNGTAGFRPVWPA